jgi:organic hydroperoxide reductase OsmC/OhrA
VNESTKSRQDRREHDLVSRRQTRTIAVRAHAVGSSGLRTISIRGFRLNSGEGDHVAGFDLGPSPEEHFLGAIAASLAQAAAVHCCARGLYSRSIGVTASAVLSRKPDGGRFNSLEATIEFESEEAIAEFSGIEAEVLATSPLAHAIAIPVELNIVVRPIDAERIEADDWQI